ncbi:MAG: hypothetical protein ACI8PT_002288 [Gammaproteobacteria bacterium]|jgi:hypothetical protein
MAETKPFGISKRAMAWLESVAYYRPEPYVHWSFAIAHQAE